jgi:hypothetical protein
MSPAKLHRRVAALLALPLVLIGCNLPADEGVTPIDPDDLPLALANTTTTSTTTTTTTTVPPVTSEPVETDPTTTTSSTLAVATAPVDLYYVGRTVDGMQLIIRQLPAPVSLDSVISQLQQPPPELDVFGVDTALREGLITGHVLERSVLTISLNSAVFDAMSEDDQREAIAQMVLTFTSFAVPGAGNIGSVIVQVDGVPIPVFKPADGTTGEPGAAVYFDDFSTLIVGTTNTPPTTAPTGSAPPTQSTAPPPTGA